MARPMPIGQGRTRKTSETNPIFRARRLCVEKKKKPLELQIIQSNG